VNIRLIFLLGGKGGEHSPNFQYEKTKTLRSIRDNHQEELAKFGYRSERKVAKSQFFWGAVSCCIFHAKHCLDKTLTI
jgi:hypothetical protein